MNKKVIIGIIIAVVVIAIIVVVAVCLNKNTTQDEQLNKTTAENEQEKLDKIREENKKTEENNNNEATDEQKEDLQKEVNQINQDLKKNVEDNKMYSTGKHHAKLEIKDYGIIELELDADVAPITVANFAKLVNEGFYDGLTFHRIMEGFMMQGGDPLGTGTGGSKENIKGEFSANGVQNSISHTRGVISMARSTAFNSASSQFFIVHEDSTFLDGQYAAFGKVTSGIEIVDKVCEDAKVVDTNGTVLKGNQPVITKITMVD